MDDRYKTHVTRLLSRQPKVLIYKRILATVADAQYRAGIHGDSQVGADIMIQPNGSIAVRWEDHEKRLQHETAAFVDAIRGELAPNRRGLVYLGMTSSDLMDTYTAIIWQEISRVITRQCEDLIAGLDRIAGFDIQRIGRTHGRLAEAVDFGQTFRRARRDINFVLNDLMLAEIPGKLSGPTGSGNIALTDQVREDAASHLGVPMDPLASQIVDRIYYERVAMALVRLVGVCEQLATFWRLSSIEGIDEFREYFGVDQKGSSVMAHKRNPIRSERICGLARVCRSNLSALTETWHTTWWERDLTNSSVERTAWWDLAQLTVFILNETTDLCETGQYKSSIMHEYWPQNTDELIRRSIRGEDVEQTYREIQARA